MKKRNKKLLRTEENRKWEKKRKKIKMAVHNERDKIKKVLKNRKGR